MVRKILDWIVDYTHVARGQLAAYVYRNPPKHYLGYVIEGKSPVILLPGIVNKWVFLKRLGDKISLIGHPIYIIPKLHYNLFDISTSANIVRELIDENNLQNVIIIAHSKGGLIGKYLLVHYNLDHRIKNLITIATPFSGSSLAKLVPHKAFKELRPESKIIKDLDSHSQVNHQIISISPIFDNHIPQEAGSFLRGAKNIQVSVHGHHKILFAKEVENEVLKLIK